MIYELRVYEVVPGRMKALNDRFDNITMKFFQKYGIKVVGFWTQDVGTSNELVYIIAFDSMAHREQAWGAFQSDPEWISAKAETERETGPLTARVTNKLMSPTSYSPLQ